ncbi:MAG: hypothetical protein HQ521_02380 [Bacteroidetes bacterium]|nr:hypothetical protein [Bacteroidota bacterium]
MSTIVTKDYELIIAKNHLGLLVLFPCFPCDAENTKAEYNIVDIAMKNGISFLVNCGRKTINGFGFWRNKCAIAY